MRDCRGDSCRRVVAPVGGRPAFSLGGDLDRFDHHLCIGPLRLAHAAQRRHPCLPLCSATGVWNVDWITFWGVMLFNTLVVTGVFDRFRRWLLAQGTADVRVQAILFAWAFGALLEGTGRLWLSMGRRCADPDYPRNTRSRRLACCGDRQ